VGLAAGSSVSIALMSDRAASLTGSHCGESNWNLPLETAWKMAASSSP